MLTLRRCPQGLSYAIEQAQAVAAAATTAAAEAAAVLRSRLSTSAQEPVSADELTGAEERYDGGAACRESALAEECREAGTKAFLSGRFEAAQRAYARAAELQPARGSLQANRAAALARLGRAPEACAACVAALSLDPSCAKAAARLVALALTAAELEAAQAAARGSESAAAAALAARLRRVLAARLDAKTLFDAGSFAAAAGAYSRALGDLEAAPEKDAAGRPWPPPLAAALSPDRGVGAPMLLANRAAARLRTGDAAGALADANAALAIAPASPRAQARREEAVRRLRDEARDAATAQRDELAAALAGRGVAVPVWPQPDAGRDAWGRNSCALCAERGRDALTCRAVMGHRAPDIEVDKWRVGGRVRFRRSAAASAPGVSLGAGLSGGGDGSAFESGEIAAFDWRTGVHTLRRDGGGGKLRVRLLRVAELSYEPPAAPALTAA